MASTNHNNGEVPKARSTRYEVSEDDEEEQEEMIVDHDDIDLRADETIDDGIH